MSKRQNDPRRVDLLALAAQGATIEGEAPLAEWPRLRDPIDDAATPIIWRAHASRRERSEGEPLLHLNLEARGDVVRICQRCLEPMKVALQIDRRIRFVRDEAEAERLDGEGDEDVLALAPALDVLSLIEDELLLELPLVPRHDQCIDPARLTASADDEALAAHPFQALEALKRPKPQ